MSEIREEVARLVWEGSGGIHWPEVKDRPAPAPDDRRPNYTDEKVAEAWATADAIMARFRLTLKISRARASGIPVREGGEQ